MLIFPTLKLSPLQGMAGMAGGVVSRTILGVGGLPEVGDFYEGGYFAGYISQNADGVATHGLLVAPKSSGESSGLQWKTSRTDTSGTSSTYDGAANTSNMSNTDHPAANFCATLSLGGYTDWYLPAPFEMLIAYRAFKPDSTNNDTGHGANTYAVPQVSAYGLTDPGQTSFTDFQSGGSEAFAVDSYWVSREVSTNDGQRVRFDNGVPDQSGKNDGLYVRAFRKFAV